MRILPAFKRRGTPATSGPGIATGPRFRPRLLTVVVFFVAATMIALANLSYDETDQIESLGHVPYRSYGWPLIWHRIFLNGNRLMGQKAIGWYYSPPRFAVNLAVWLSLLAALAGGCEWLLRRYRPRPRWGLRGLLAFVALVALPCGWYAHARNRAAIQDPLIPLRAGYGVPLVFVERWGPKWLDVLGMDRLRRRIVLANYWSLDAREPATERQFLELVRAPDLRHLVCLRVDELTATTAKALGGMRRLETLDMRLQRLTADLPAALSELQQLRSLSIAWEYYSGTGMESEPADDNDARLVDECLAAIGNMTRLETLQLRGWPLHGRGLACLAGLKGLPRLEALGIEESDIEDDDLRRLAALPRLKSLNLGESYSTNAQLFTPAGLASLGSLDSLEEVRLACDFDSPETIEALGAIRGLKRLHLSDMTFRPDDVHKLTLDDGEELRVADLGKFRRAFGALRQSKPGLVIDTEEMPIFSKSESAADLSHFKVDAFPERPAAWLPGGDLTWMTPKELADFEQAGGRASFEGATPPDPNKKGTGGGVF